MVVGTVKFSVWNATSVNINFVKGKEMADLWTLSYTKIKNL